MAALAHLAAALNGQATVAGVIKTTEGVPVIGHTHRLDEPSIIDVAEACILHYMTGNTPGFSELIFGLLQGFCATTVEATTGATCG